MEKIAIYGAGGFGKDVAFLLETLPDQYEMIGFFDDKVEQGTQVCGYNVLGNLAALNQFEGSLNIAFAINNAAVVERLVAGITKQDVNYPNLIHPASYVDLKTLNIGRGNIFNINVIVSKDVTIGNFNNFNNRVAIGHDVVLGDFNNLSPNTQISGGVVVGNKNSFGLNSSVIQYKKVGNSNQIGACSLVIRNVGDGNSVFGVPAIVSKF